jgi:hypothetical protein
MEDIVSCFIYACGEADVGRKGIFFVTPGLHACRHTDFPIHKMKTRIPCGFEQFLSQISNLI